MNLSGPTRPTTLGACATLACVWEATAAKPGNVYRGADFADMTYADMLASAVVIGPVIDRCGELGLGRTVLEAVRATHDAVGVNTNLGTLLLVVPLALAAGGRDDLADRATGIVQRTTHQDTRDLYQAIRRAAPGGLGTSEEGDVAAEPVHTLVEAMRLAEHRDRVARQYVRGWEDVLAAAARIEAELAAGWSLDEAIVAAQLALLAAAGDSLVERKLGAEASGDLKVRAAAVLATRNQSPEAYHAACKDLDFYLRTDGHRRNPGTTADLLAAALFVLLVEDRLSWPVRFYGPSSADHSN